MLTIDGKEFRNLEEQVLKNKNDIENALQLNNLLSDFGIRIIGQVESAYQIPSVSNYKENNPNWKYGDAYTVGTESPYDLYILTRANNNSLLNYLLSSELYNKNTKYLIENPIVNVRAKDQITPSKANKKRNKVKREINYKFSVETEISDDLYNEFTDLHKRQQAWMQDEMDRTERRSHYNDSKLEAFIKEVSSFGCSSSNLTPCTCTLTD